MAIHVNAPRRGLCIHAAFPILAKLDHARDARRQAGSVAAAAAEFCVALLDPAGRISLRGFFRGHGACQDERRNPLPPKVFRGTPAHPPADHGMTIADEAQQAAVAVFMPMLVAVLMAMLVPVLVVAFAGARALGKGAMFVLAIGFL